MCRNQPNACGGIMCRNQLNTCGGIMCRNQPNACGGIMCRNQLNTCGGIMCRNQPNACGGIMCRNQLNACGGIMCRNQPNAYGICKYCTYTQMYVLTYLSEVAMLAACLVCHIAICITTEITSNQASVCTLQWRDAPIISSCHPFTHGPTLHPFTHVGGPYPPPLHSHRGSYPPPLRGSYPHSRRGPSSQAIGPLEGGDLSELALPSSICGGLHEATQQRNVLGECYSHLIHRTGGLANEVQEMCTPYLQLPGVGRQTLYVNTWGKISALSHRTFSSQFRYLSGHFFPLCPTNLILAAMYVIPT